MNRIMVFGLAATALLSSSAWACPWCRTLVKAGVYNQDFAGNLLLMVLPILVLAFIATGIYFFADRLFAPTPIKEPQTPAAPSARLPESTTGI